MQIYIWHGSLNKSKWLINVSTILFKFKMATLPTCPLRENSIAHVHITCHTSAIIYIVMEKTVLINV